MSGAYLFTTGLSTTAIVIIGILLLAAGLGKRLRDKASLWFFYLVLANLLSALPELIIAGLVGTPGTGLRVWIKVLNYLTYLLAAFSMIAFANYVYEYISTKTVISKRPVQVACVINGIGMVLHAIAEITDLYSWFDEQNYYHKTELFWIGYAPSTAALLVCFSMVMKHRKKLHVQEWVVLTLYMVSPVICYILESLYTDVWVAYFGVAITLLLIYIAIQVELMLKIQKQNQELAESRTAIMLSQIQPHFLYNSLTAIGKLCDIDPKKTKVAINDFADYLRGNITSIRTQGQIYFIDELEHVEAYLALEQLRFQDRLQVTLDITVEDFVLPSLTVQPLVENAVQHGITRKSEGGTVCIRTELTDHGVRIIVADDGVGFDPAIPQNDGRVHVGIENVRGRLLALCGGSLEVQSAPGQGTTAIITIPHMKEQEDLT